MKNLIFFLILVLSVIAFSQDQEGNLQQPVSDLDEIQKEEEALPPTIDEVPMYEEDSKREKEKAKTKSPDRSRSDNERHF